MYTVLLKNSETQEIFDISSLVNSISYFTSLSGQAGKLTFTVEKDPNDILTMALGSVVYFSTDTHKVFLGYVFDLSTDGTETYRVVAYDQMRYLKGQDSLYVDQKTASDLFKDICLRTNIQNYEIKTPSAYKIEATPQFNKTYFDMLSEAMTSSFLNEKKMYCIQDRYGVLTFDELENMKTDWIIGDESLLTSYQYGTSIDKDTFTRVKIVQDNGEEGQKIAYIAPEVTDVQKMNNIAKWGVLQKVETVPQEYNEAQIKELANNILDLKSRSTKTMKLSALGLSDLTAGVGFNLHLSKLDIFQPFWIESATHNYNADIYTMELEVFIQ